MDIDKQRIAAVRKLQSLDYVFQGGEWVSQSVASDPAMPVIPVIPEADAMHGLLMRRADVAGRRHRRQRGRGVARHDRRRLEAYEVTSWPFGKEPGGKV